MSYSKLHQNYNQNGHGSAISSVMHTSGITTMTETKQGAYVYGAEPASYHEWEFRTRLRMQNKKDPEKYAEAISKVVEGLRGDAFVVAQTVG